MPCGAFFVCNNQTLTPDSRSPRRNQIEVIPTNGKIKPEYEELAPQLGNILQSASSAQQPIGQQPQQPSQSTT